ncbi:hypothetical protein T440DRAFT_483347 [Plenodomus tracheiphilus IPT5]|uniref:Pal1-domain-containing protein n=1 Tax=Plenodomus tracheiphilus IPT5 TaxID=1408161 RepID=A0A6A7AQW0_9PLEO|nr:hypothetical protein T440DRAFT_483347 [Plenodomus tracheiphilus IPT5]
MAHPHNRGSTQSGQPHLEMPDAEFFATQYRMVDHHVQDVQVPPTRLPYPIPVRQASMGDYSRKIHPLPPPPASEHDSDQDLPVIEPGTHLDDTPDYNTAVPDDLNFRTLNLITNTANNVVDTDEPNMNANVAGNNTSIPIGPIAESNFSDYGNDISRMPTDEYTSALGGLHNISAIQRKESKRERTKRFFKGLKRGLSGRRA